MRLDTWLASRGFHSTPFFKQAHFGPQIKSLLWKEANNLASPGSFCLNEVAAVLQQSFTFGVCDKTCGPRPLEKCTFFFQPHCFSTPSSEQLEALWQRFKCQALYSRNTAPLFSGFGITYGKLWGFCRNLSIVIPSLLWGGSQRGLATMQIPKDPPIFGEAYI